MDKLKFAGKVALTAPLWIPTFVVWFLSRKMFDPDEWGLDEMWGEGDFWVDEEFDD